MSKEKKEDQITVSYDKISSEYINEHGKESILILALLSRHYTIRRELVFNLQYLYDNLNTSQRSKTKRYDIISSINSMFKVDLKISPTKIVTVPYNSPKQQYLILKDIEINTILSYKDRIDIYSLFNTYVSIKRYVNKDTNKAYPSIATLMDITNISSNNTIIKYIEILEDLNMIQCSRSDRYVLVKGSPKRPNNQYSILM